MRILDSTATHRLLPYGELADELRAVLRDKRAGIAVAPQRLSLPLSANGLLLAMPAADGDIAITKLVTVHPDNAAHKLPSIQGEVIVMNARTGQRLMILDGKAVTARRTAALSLLAAQMLASYEARRGPLLIIGAGTQGRAHLEALGEGMPRRNVFICSRTFDNAEALARHGRLLGVAAQAIGNVEEVMPICSMIVTATTSSEPVLPDRVRNDAFVAAIGAYTHEMAELPPELVRRGRVFVDTIEGAQAEAGDLIRAGVDWSKVSPLEDIVEMRHGPSHHQPIIFKSVGHALWDLAAARLAARNLRAVF
jgi:ornithine cyclodeaminase